MKRRHAARNAGALGVTALLGFGCSQADSDGARETASDGLTFPDRLRATTEANDNPRRELPRPTFGPLAGHPPPSPSQNAADEPTLPNRNALMTTASTAAMFAPLEGDRPEFGVPTARVVEPDTVPSSQDVADERSASPGATFDRDAPLPIELTPVPELSVRPILDIETVTLGNIPAEFASAEPRKRSVSKAADVNSAEVPPASPSAPLGVQAAQLPPPIAVPPLASIVPPQRAPVTMVTVDPPVVDTVSPVAANDTRPTVPTATVVPTAGAELPTGGPSVSAPDVASPREIPTLVPPNRTQTTLGLANPVQTTGDTNALAQERTVRFSGSSEAPQLDYQDELILELKVAGVDASDTILAYGTRQGVYLPIGTLARILDLAITVQDGGNYASGWVLDQTRTLAIDLRRNLLTIAGREQPLPRGAATAFDGELFLLADRIAGILPLTVDTDLRAQTITLTTLETFPFEARMKREADRARLANRAAGGRSEIFTRVNTPFLLASIPVGDVDLRAISESTFGSRAEIDLQFAGDLGYLTAETFLSADTKNGLTTSLIKVGRQDPNAQLLGPLSATEFALGDVATVSMPLGLRSVTGRGFAIANTPAEAFSVFEKIDLRGILPDGFEVELYRNDILISSTREAVGGRYEFLQVPVDFGLNVFRLVFFGPQGQRSEEVRRISVGDGRLPTGKLVYRFGAVQKDQNLLGVQPPFFIRPRDFGNWRASGELAYGVSSDITAVVSGAWFETEERNRWISTAGIRTGVGGFAVKADLAAGDGGAFAVSGGIGGRIGASAITLSHVEYSGNFIDETRGGVAGGGGFGGTGLTRSTEVDFNTTLELGDPISGFVIPLTARARRTQSEAGLTTLDATLRASTRLSGVLASNTFDYTRTSFDGLESRSRLFGNFDLATLGRSRTRGRLSFGYQVLPKPDILSAAVEVDHAIDEDTAVRASLGYLFETQSPQIGLSAVRDFDRFSLALDGNYAFERNEHSIGLRLGFSFGRDPLRGGFFIARPGLAHAGIASVRAFRDMDGDGIFGPPDSVLSGVSVIAANRVVPTDAGGLARIGNLGPGRGASLQIDGSTLPDIDLAPASEGLEIVPRPGRIHVADFPIVAVSEVEGTVRFSQGDGDKGVSGVRLKLRDAQGKDAYFTKTEIDGYYFFERVRPGIYTVALDEGQASRLDLCAAQDYSVTVGYEADLVKADIAIGVCSETAEAP